VVLGAVGGGRGRHGLLPRTAHPPRYNSARTWRRATRPQRPKDQHTPEADAIEPLSQIINDLNERFGTDFSEEDRIVIAHLVQKFTGDLALTTSVQVNTPKNTRLTFDHVVTDHLQDMVDTNFEFYKRITGHQAFARFFLDWLFDQVQAQLKSGE
jgi:type I restriction enzyme R subunit